MKSKIDRAYYLNGTFCIYVDMETTFILTDERSQERVSGRPYQLDGSIWKAFSYRFVSFRPLLGFQERAFAKHR